jgi:hemoglobin/transferrin/lactoferrin receptor protein
MLMLLCIDIINGQTVQVVDNTTQTPLEHVIVKAEGVAIGITNSTGYVTLKDNMSYTSLTFSLTGYETAVVLYADILAGITIIELTEKVFDLDAIVVSASRFDDNQREVAQEISTVTAKEIAFQNAATTADVLQNNGEVLVQKSQLGGGSPILRGFEASRVLMVVDGVRMNNAIYRAGHLQNIITMDQNILSRIEIAFGPSSVVYGSDALGGAMHFITRDPILKTAGMNVLSGNAYVRYASAAQEKTAHLNLNMAGAKCSALTAFTLSDFNDLKAGSKANAGGTYGDFGFRPIYAETIYGVDTIVKNEDASRLVQSGYAQYDVLQKFLYQANATSSHLINFQFSNSTNVPRYDRLTDPGAEPNSLRFAEWYYGPQKRLLFAYNFLHTASKGIYNDMRITASYQDIDESRHTRRFGEREITHREETVKVYGMAADFSKNFATHKLRYGVESYFNHVLSMAENEDIINGEVTPASTRYPDGGSSMQNVGVYVTHSASFGNGKWVLNDGLRYAASNLQASFVDTSFYPFPFSDISQGNDAVTGSLGIVFLPDATWKISALASTGFRTPNIDDLAKIFDSSPGTVILPNPDLKPEQSYNADLHVAKILAGKIEVEATAYYTLFRNYLTTSPGTFNGADSIVYDGVLSQVLTSTNAGEAYLWGFNIGIDAGIVKGLTCTSYITYTYGRIQTDSVPYPLDHIPPLYGKTSLNLQISKWRAEFYGLYNAWKRIEDYNLESGEDNVQYATIDGMPAWFTLNLKTAFAVSESIQLQAGIENLLDLNYRVFASGISAPGRNVFFTLRGKF